MLKPKQQGREVLVTDSTEWLEWSLQRLVDDAGVPDESLFQSWLETALADAGPVSVNLRIVDEAEGWALNRQWRGKDGPTNVLSFPADMPLVDGRRVLGDIVLCAPVIAREAVQQGKVAGHHWAHLTIHGALHLLGYDHIEASAAERMEALEVDLLSRLGMANPY